MEAMTYGINCGRCGVYFLTKNRLENLCPWCTRVQTGSYPERAMMRAEDPVSDEF